MKFATTMIRMTNCQKKNSYYYNKKRKDVEFFKGDKVLLKNHIHGSKEKNIQLKLTPKYKDNVFVIGKKYSPLTYELLDLNGKSKGWNHIFNLKLYKERSFENENNKDNSYEKFQPRDSKSDIGNETEERIT